MFFINSVLLGFALAMDAFSVSASNGLREPDMKKRKIFLIAGVFGAFQAVMPISGWFFVTSLEHFFSVVRSVIPWASLLLLCFLGVKMIIEGIKCETADGTGTGLRALLVQGVATSIDALSVGLTISDYTVPEAVLSALIIGAVTFAICVAGVLIGRKLGTLLSGKGSIIGGVVLIGIGIEIFVKALIDTSAPLLFIR